jgi:cephalosporin hydroxylase
MTTFSGKDSRQQPDEMAAMIELFLREGVRSYLEIGCCYGDSFHQVVSSLPAGSRGVAIDMVYGPWGKRDSDRALRKAVSDLWERGYDTSVLFGDSKAADVQQFAAERGPYDAVLIDGDHSYNGVLADWKAYSHLAHIVAFHDIDGGGASRNLTIDVPRLWSELKAAHRHVEIIGRERGMGIGVLWRE